MDLEIFRKDDFEIRVAVDEKNEPLFCLNDVCRVLDISDPKQVRDAINTEFEKEGVFYTYPFETAGGIQNFTMITEPQLYFVLMRSNKPNAKPFRMWVNNEILPAIRKHGGYLTPAKIEEVPLAIEKPKKYGRLTIIRELERGVKPSGQKYRRVECLCECGNKKIVHLSALKSGNTQSCGCLQKEVCAKMLTKHGMSFSRIERIYWSMKQRCYNKKNKDYPRYGGRGIKVCEAWQDFSNFYKDVKDIYKDGLTIERIDIDRGYCKENVTFIEPAKQQRNKSTNLFFIHDGKRRCLAEICEIEGRPYHRTWQRIVRSGKTLEEALHGC